MRHPALLITLTAALVLSFTATTAGAQDPDRVERRAAFKAKMFEKLDLNGDETVTQEEFLQAHTERLEKRFGMVDADGNGNITKTEFQNAKMKHRGSKKGWKGNKQRQSEKTDE